jgi:hypothetical protein
MKVKKTLTFKDANLPVKITIEISPAAKAFAKDEIKNAVDGLVERSMKNLTELPYVTCRLQDIKVS